jgi:hypothetical protein
MTRYPFLAYVAVFSPLLPISAGIYKVSIISREMKILIVYLIIGLIANIISMWFIENYWINLGIWHINVVVEYICVMSIVLFWQESQIMRWIFISLLVLYILFWFCAKLTFEPLNGLYSITSSVSQVILVLGAGYTLFIVIGNHTQPLLSHQRFWVLLSFVLNYTCILMPLALAGVLFDQLGDSLTSLWSINWTVTIFSNILFTIGFLCPQTQT